MADVPAAILNCAARPAVPNDPRQKDVAGFITDLAAAHGECRDNLGQVRIYLEDLKELYDDEITRDKIDSDN